MRTYNVGDKVFFKKELHLKGHTGPVVYEDQLGEIRTITNQVAWIQFERFSKYELVNKTYTIRRVPLDRIVRKVDGLDAFT